jgi:hypothetical protein
MAVERGAVEANESEHVQNERNAACALAVSAQVVG